MKKLLKSLHWVDDNLVHISLIFFIIATVLLPKIPFQFVEYTYIRIRFDDLLPVLIGVIFFIQLIRRKVTLNTQFVFLIGLFWFAVFLSFVYGTYIQNTIPVANIGLLHSLRRPQYMIIFFVAASAITSKKRFFTYMNLYLALVGIVALYGFGQKFLQFPSIQSMNPAYVDGRLLTLNPGDRINSTFGGHFDLAAYLTFSMPILIGFYFFSKKKRYLGVFVLALLALLYTAARSSFFAYIITISLFLLFIRKFKFYGLVIILTVILLLVTGDMTRRFQQTFQLKTVFVNEQTGSEKIDQKITTKELPAGQFEIPFLKKLNAKSNSGPISSSDQQKIQNVALEQAIKEAQKKGKKINTQEIQNRADEIAKFIKPQRTVLCDISCATRLQLEWPRAIGAFAYNPLLGTGPSSITEATDNDFLRWLGEFGVFGSTIFVFLVYQISKRVRNALEKDSSLKYLSFGFGFGLIALFINGFYVDVFEASKVAYNFWLVAGLYIGFSQLTMKKEYEKGKKK